MSGSSQAPLDLALPGAQRLVQHWAGAPANSTGAPIRTVPAPQPQVIYAERKPRLTRLDLMARHGIVAPTARPALSVVAAPEAAAPRGRGLGAARLARWLAIVLAGLAVVASTPLS